jgi:tetratricopeptide (TPR) repeat protein
MSPDYQEYRKLMAAGRYLEAAGVAEQAYLGDNPNNPFWLTRQAGALTRAGQTERALQAADQALALQPSNPYAVLAKAAGLLGKRCLRPPNSLWNSPSNAF